MEAFVPTAAVAAGARRGGAPSPRRYG